MFVFTEVTKLSTVHFYLVIITTIINGKSPPPQPSSIHSDLGEVIESISLSPASLQVSQFQLQSLQAAGTQRAAEQFQEQRAGHHACQLVQQPLATWRGNDWRWSSIAKGLFLAVADLMCPCCLFGFAVQKKHVEVFRHELFTCCRLLSLSESEGKSCFVIKINVQPDVSQWCTV